MNNFLNKFFGTGRSDVNPATGGRHMAATAPIVIVSGLPRSGTSMMMKVLEAGGLPVVIDGLRAADPDNPEGYYEFERVKELDKGGTAWVADAQGKAVKVISALLEYLPTDYDYRVIFMHRKIEEVLNSQRKMLARRGEPIDAVSDAEMAALFAKHVAKVKAWLREQPNFAVLEIDYNAMLIDPDPHVRIVNQFIDNALDEEAMAKMINPDLYRNRV
jgi:RNase adaptor protein for sRNA GlmZ degradation